MVRQDKIRLLGEKIEAADSIVVGSASGMSAASGFKFYYADDDVFKKIAGGLREKYGSRTYFDAYYDRRIREGNVAPGNQIYA